MELKRILLTIIFIASCSGCTTELSSWAAIDTCTVTCGGGTQTYERTCCSGTAGNSGNCPTSQRSTEQSAISCNTMCCQVDGGWTDWADWSACPVTCEGTPNNQFRSRNCTDPAPSCNGANCTDFGESDTEYQTCNANCCPVDGGWATWEEWTSCSLTCESGIKNRYRNCSEPEVYCGGTTCSGCSGSLCSQDPQTDTNTAICNDFDCFYCENREIGYGNPSLYTENIGVNTGYGVLAESIFYVINCCGAIRSWEFFASNAGELHLMVWRKSGSTYTLIGKNIYTVPNGAVGFTLKYTVRELDRITIKHDDILGWYTPGVEIIPYNTSDPQNFRLTSMSVVEVGETFDWSSVSLTHGRAYAVRIFTDNNSVPFFTNLERDVVIFDDEPFGSSIYKVEYYNGETEADDEIALTFTSSTPDISFNISSDYVYIVAGLDVGNYTMNFSLTDSCANTADGSLTIRVFNTPPRITSLPSFATLHENTRDEQLLHTLVVDDKQSTDNITCELTSAIPATGNFSVTQIIGTSGYGIYLLANAELNYDTSKKYQLLISCDDGKNTAVSGYFFVHVERNHPPEFINLPASIDLDASAVSDGDLIFTINMEDAENDTLTYNMTTEPSNGPFTLDGGSIIATNNMSNIFEPAYNLVFFVNDGRTVVGPRTLSVHVTNINDIPVISNLPLMHPFLIEENSAVGTTLYHIRVYDLDLNDTITISGVFEPSTTSVYFNLSNDGYLTISSNLDFESLSNTSMQIMVYATDGKNTATATIALTITDQNEAPVFNETEYSIEVNESSQFEVLPPVGFAILDPDLTDSSTYWLDCGNDTWRFTMANETGEISYAYDYDLDTLLTTQFNCVVKVKDTGYNTGTTNLTITIVDINDNSPYFNQTQYVFYITPYETIGTIIGDVKAYDIDITDYGIITYNLDMSAYTTLYVKIYDNGTLYVNELLHPNFKYGDVITLNLTANDTGGLETRVKIWIVLAEVQSDTSIATENQQVPMTFLCSSKNVLWLTAVGILFFIMILLILRLKLWPGSNWMYEMNLVDNENTDDLKDTHDFSDKQETGSNGLLNTTDDRLKPLAWLNTERSKSLDIPANLFTDKSSNTGGRFSWKPWGLEDTYAYSSKKDSSKSYLDQPDRTDRRVKWKPWGLDVGYMYHYKPREFKLPEDADEERNYTNDEIANNSKYKTKPASSIRTDEENDSGNNLSWRPWGIDSTYHNELPEESESTI